MRRLCIFKENTTLRLYKGISFPLEKCLTFYFRAKTGKEQVGLGERGGQKKKEKEDKDGVGKGTRVASEIGLLFIGLFIEPFLCAKAQNSPSTVRHEFWPKGV